MTTLQKTLVATTLVAAVATSLHKSRQAAHFEKEARDAEARRGTEVARLRMARDEVEDRLAAIRAENQRLRDDIRKLPQLRAEISRLQRASEELVRAKSASPEGEFDSSVQSWALRARTLKERLIQTPEAGIPDLQFVTEEDWLDAARDNLDSEAEVLRAFSLLRTAGEQKFARMLTDAVQQFGFHNEKRFPTDLRQLQPYFKMPVNEAILNRWMITSPKEVPNVNFGYDVIITQKEAVDEIFDTRFVVAPGGGHGSTSFPQDFKERLKPLQDAYHAANHGKTPHGKHVMALQEMLPYANPEQRLLIEKVMLQVETNQ